MTSQTAHAKYKWPPYATEWNFRMKTFCAHHCWQLLWFAYAPQLINLIEAKSEGLFYQGLEVTMRFYFKLWLVLVTSDCGITAECGVDKSVDTSAAHVCAFCETKSLCKTQSVTLTYFFCGTNSYNRQAEDQPEVGCFKNIFTHSDYFGPNSFRLCRPGSGSSV